MITVETLQAFYEGDDIESFIDLFNNTYMQSSLEDKNKLLIHFVINWNCPDFIDAIYNLQ